MEKIRMHLLYMRIGDEVMLDIPDCSGIRLAIKRTDQDRYEVRRVYKKETLWHFGTTIYMSSEGLKYL